MRNNQNKILSFKNCLLLSTICAGLLYSTNARADADILITSLLKNYTKGKVYNATINTPTGVDGERSVKNMNSSYPHTYYFVADDEDNSTYSRLLDYITNGSIGFVADYLVSTDSGSAISLKIMNYPSSLGNYYINQVSFPDMKITIEEVSTIEANSTGEYDYYHASPDGTIKYYKYNKAGSGDRVSSFSSNYKQYTVIAGKSTTNDGGGINIKEGIESYYLGAGLRDNTTTGNGGGVYNPLGTNVHFMMLENMGNSATRGGGVYNEGNIDFVVGDFFTNQATVYGGAVYNKGTIGSLDGYFNNNTAIKGAAVYNDAEKEITAISGDFNSNSAEEYGGAIYNNGTIGLLTNRQDITFYNNTDSTGYNDLYGGTYNLNAQSGYKIDFGGSIRSATALNINNNTSATNRGGDYVFNNTVDAGVNLYNGANVKLANINQVDGTTSYGVINTTKKLTVDSVAGTNIDMRNDHIDTNTVGGMTLGSNIGLDIDTNLRRHSTSTSDKILSTATATGDGKMVINSINLLNSAYGEGDSIKIIIADDKTKGSIMVAEDILDNVTGATNYYTKIEYDEDTGELVFTDKLVNKSALDQALTDAGIGDMSIYAKTADVADTYATKEALTTGLGNKVDTSAFNEYKTEVGNTYATKEALGSYAKSSDVADTYATKEALTTGLGNKVDTSAFNEYKTEVGNTYATKEALGSYAKSSDVADTYATKEALTTGLGNKVDTSAFNEYKTEVGNTYATKEALGSYATTDSVYTKTQADNAFATKGSSYTKSESDDKYATKSSLDSYVTTESLGTTLGGYVTTGGLSTTLNDYATKASLNDYATKASLNDYATKASLDSYVTSESLNSTLGGYVTTGGLTSALSGYATTGSVYTKTEIDTTLGGYVKASEIDGYISVDLADYAKTADVYTQTQADNKFATKEAIGDMLTKTEAGNTYAKANDVYTKSQVYSKGEIDTTLGGYVTTESLGTTLGSYATTDSVYTKTEADNAFAAKGASYTKSESDDKYATKSSLDNYVTSESLNTTLGSYATTDSVYTKTQADNTFAKASDVANTYATKEAIGDMLTKTEAGTTYATKASLNDYVKSDALDTKLNDYVKTDALDGAIDTKLTGYAKTSDLNDYAKSADVYTKDEADGKYATQNAVSALTDRMTQAENGITNINNSAVMKSGITAEKVAAYEGYAAKIDAKQDALTTEQMAVLNSGITAADIATVQTANTRLDAMDTTVADLSADFGDVADFSNSETGNLKNDVPSSSKPNASTVTKAIANMDATIGQIHGLAAKVGVENGGANLGQNTTVEEHVTALAGAIGNRTHYTQQNYIKNNQTVAQSLDNLDVAVGSIRRDFNSAQIANEARFNGIENKVNKLESKMEKGLAANNALAALVPLSDKYKTQLSMAMGGYESNQAFAIGGFHYVTERVLLNTGVAYGGDDSISYGVGVTFGF